MCLRACERGGYKKRQFRQLALSRLQLPEPAHAPGKGCGRRPEGISLGVKRALRDRLCPAERRLLFQPRLGFVCTRCALCVVRHRKLESTDAAKGHRPACRYSYETTT